MLLVFYNTHVDLFTKLIHLLYVHAVSLVVHLFIMVLTDL